MVKRTTIDKYFPGDSIYDSNLKNYLNLILAAEEATDSESDDVNSFLDDEFSPSGLINYLIDAYGYNIPLLKHGFGKYMSEQDDVTDDYFSDWDPDSDEFEDDDFESDNHFPWEGELDDGEEHSHLTVDVDNDGNADIEAVDMGNDGDIDFAKVKDGKGNRKATEVKDDLLGDNTELDSTGTLKKEDKDPWDTITDTLSGFRY